MDWREANLAGPGQCWVSNLKQQQKTTNSSFSHFLPHHNAPPTPTPTEANSRNQHGPSPGMCHGQVCDPGSQRP